MPTRSAILAIASLAMIVSSVGAAETPKLGKPIAPADIAAWDISVGADGLGLPPGGGTAKQGEAVYNSKCISCHGALGAGTPYDRLVGGIGTLVAPQAPVRTVGSYWPYATTFFDYARRAMPFNETKSLSNDELYAVTAYVLQLNGVISEGDVMNAQSLPKVRMPNRDGFVPFKRGD